MMLKVNVDKISEIILSGIRATMNEKDRNATGRSVASLYSEFDPNEMVLTIYGDEHWQYIDRGRTPGGKPPYSRILEWCVAKGIPKEAAWAIRTNIGLYGAPRKIRGTSIDQTKLNVIEDTMKEVEPDLLRELGKEAQASFEATIGKQWQSL
jgi:hypothetical protein